MHNALLSILDIIVLSSRNVCLRGLDEFCLSWFFGKLRNVCFLAWNLSSSIGIGVDPMSLDIRIGSISCLLTVSVCHIGGRSCVTHHEVTASRRMTQMLWKRQQPTSHVQKSWCWT